MTRPDARNKCVLVDLVAGHYFHDQSCSSRRRSIVFDAIGTWIRLSTRSKGKGVFINTRTIMHVGIALILLGIVAVVYRHVSFTRTEKVRDITQEVSRVDTQMTLPLSPLAGALALVGGVVLVIVGIKRSS